MTNHPYRGWEYAKDGDYHRNLDPNWSYTPTYLSKRSHVRSIVEAFPRDAKILDLACGEGVIVEEFQALGFDIVGLDYNYESELVKRGDARNLPFTDELFDVVIFLDAFEHFGFPDQTVVLKEIYRVLRPDGHLIMTIPNLAHLNSRFSFFFQGRLDRTDNELDHLGERPISENRKSIGASGFAILKETGITLTAPLLYRGLICQRAAKYRWLHDAMEPLAARFPTLAMLNLFVCQKSEYLRNRIPDSQRAVILDACPNKRLFSIRTHITERERQLLLQLASAMKMESTAVEIGSYLGASSCFIAEGLRRHNSKLFAVDTWTNIGMSEGARDTFEIFLGNIAAHQDWITPLRGLSAEVAKNFKNSIDFLFIDGDHTYNGAAEDLRSWLPKLNDNAVVLFHDYSWAEGVQKAVQDLVLPIQTEPARKLDTIYWTRVAPSRLTKSPLRASVVIPTYRRMQYLIDALHSMIHQECDFSYEILVLDNAGDRPLKEEVERLSGTSSSPPIRYIHVPEIGLHNARNIGSLEGRGEIIVYVDDDVLAPQGWLQQVVAPFGDESVGAVAGKVIAQWEGTRPEWLDAVSPFYFSLLDLGEKAMEMKWPQAPHGCNMAIRRSLIVEMDGFPPDGVGDSGIPWKRGDGEYGFFRKVMENGIHVVYQPSACLTHRIPASRMTRKAILYRAQKEAILTGYMEYRRFPCRRRALLKHGVIHLLRSARFSLKSTHQMNVTPAQKILTAIQATHEFFLGLYKLKIVFDKNHREWIMKPNYWPERFND